MMLVPSCGAILQVALERKPGAEESDVVPGNLLRGHELHLEAFRSRAEDWGRELRPEKHVHLMRVHDAHQGEEGADFDLREGFFLRLASGALLQGLAVLHESGGHRPEPQARLDGALADEDPALMLRHAPDDDARVLIMDRAAAVAHEAGQVIAGRDALRDAGAAL